MNDAPNTHQWKIGDIVIHDADAKQERMLMVVIGYHAKTGQCRTRYVRRDINSAKKYLNDLKYLHDPARFGLATQEPVAQEG